MKLNLHVKDSPHRKRSPRFFLLITGIAMACFIICQAPSAAFANSNKVLNTQDERIPVK